MTNEIQPGNLELLVGKELSAVTFIRDYLQLEFDETHFQTLVWPKLTTSEGVVDFGSPGYRDLLCEQIGRSVIEAIHAPGRALVLRFESDVRLTLSLTEEDQTGPETALLWHKGLLLTVWRAGDEVTWANP